MSIRRVLLSGLFIFVLVGVAAMATAAEPIRVLYDDAHGQRAGNADWVITGAYSEMADLLKGNGFVIDSLKTVAPDGKFTAEVLAGYKALIIAEPNNEIKPAEADAIVAFIENGGGAFFIADHGGADRDNDGWDAVKVFNTFCPRLGFEFKGDFFYEAPVAGATNKDHPVMFAVRGLGAWAGSTIAVQRNRASRAVSLIDSRRNKGPYAVAAEAGKGRVVALGDSSPFDDGTGSGGAKALHDSYDSFAYSHPQFAYNAMTWVTGGTPAKRIPSRQVKMASEAQASEKEINLLVDAAHGNAASDKMETFERHMNKLGIKVFYTLTLLTPETLAKFKTLILPDPSMPILDAERKAICDWLMAGGRLLVTGDWDSADLQGRGYVNELLAACGSVMRLNDDQVWDQTNKTNKPWGVISHVLKADHPVTAGVKQVITWGTCSLITRDDRFLDETSGVEVLVMGDDDTFNKRDRDNHNPKPLVAYPKGGFPRVPVIAAEKLANGILVVSGCSNFTDYQYPDSDINLAKPGPAPFTHETALFYDNLISWMAGKVPARAKTQPSARSRR